MKWRHLLCVAGSLLLVAGCLEPDDGDTSPPNDTSSPDTADAGDASEDVFGVDFCETHPGGYPYYERTIYPAVDGEPCSCVGESGEWSAGDPLLDADYVSNAPWMNCDYFECSCLLEGRWECNWRANDAWNDDECINPRDW